MRRRFPSAVYEEQTDEQGLKRQVARRARGPSRLPATMWECC